MTERHAPQFGLYIELITSGLDPAADRIIQLVAIRFRISDDGGKLLFVDGLSALENAAQAIDAEVSALTGIDKGDVFGQAFDDLEVQALATGIEIILSPNAQFTRPFALRRFPFLSGIAWRNSWMTVIDAVPEKALDLVYRD